MAKDYHIKMETKDGITRWLETESSGEKTFIFESFYDSENVCRSEELVAWIWGDIENEETVQKWAEQRILKAEYKL